MSVRTHLYQTFTECVYLILMKYHRTRAVAFHLCLVTHMYLHQTFAECSSISITTNFDMSYVTTNYETFLMCFFSLEYKFIIDDHSC